MPRMRENIEAYIDDYEQINAYINKNFFQGNSSSFYLKDSQGNLISLTVKDKIDKGGYFQYVLKPETAVKVGEKYQFFEEHCQPVTAQYSHIVKTERFAKEFTYDGDDLGITYTPEKTTFKLWAPTAFSVKLLLDHKGKEQILDMNKEEKGLWSLTVSGDLKGAGYQYGVDVNGKIEITADPYNMLLGINTEKSYVDDILSLPLAKKVEMKETASPVDAIVYEASIRDMTSQLGMDIDHPRQFLGFIEENETTKEKKEGFSYLKDLGITHVQLMPVLDFGSTDEQYPNQFYNWGYDPNHYRGLEGSYSSNPQDYKSRVVELSQLIQTLHENGMKVILDVVFNHVYNREKNVLNKTVPDYFFLMNSQGEYSNGSFCGNDIDSRPAMSKKYFVDTVKKLIEVYDIDGLRFDLMGVLDIDLMNTIEKEAHKLKKDFILYGEGWNMPSFVPEDIRATDKNQAKMPHIGQFSDRFREVIRGSNGDLKQKGFAAGDISRMNAAREVMIASINEGKFDSPEKVVNYVECHDNHTFWDKLAVCAEEDNEDTKKKKHILVLAMVLLAQGIPFLHAGQEFARTKQGLGNTYNKPDIYNLIDYNRKNENVDLVNQSKKLIEIRKKHPSLRLPSADLVRSNVSTETIGNHVLVYKTNKDEDHLVSFFNPTERYFEYYLGRDYLVEFDSGGLNSEKTNKVVIGPYSTVVASQI